jgi:site-specific DNA-methyltransferase (adenine-specific)
MVELIMGDCLEEMEKLINRGVKVDAVITDPPYNIGKAEWDTWQEDNAYYEFMTKVLSYCEKLLKPTGSLYWFHNQIQFITKMLNWFDEKSMLNLKSFITWDKGDVRASVWKSPKNGKSNLRSWFPTCEYIMFHAFADGGTGWGQVKNRVESWPNLRDYFRRLLESLRINGEKPSYKQVNEYLGHRKAEHCFYWNSTQWELPTKETYEELLSIRRVGEFKVEEYEKLKEEYEKLKEEYEKLKEEYEKLRYTFNLGCSMNNVWRIPYILHQGEKIFHTTQKPIWLMNKIINASTNQNDLVFDPFMGSGSTVVACKQLRRNFIGIELNREYFEIAKDRIGGTIYEPSLFEEEREIAPRVEKQRGLFD